MPQEPPQDQHVNEALHIPVVYDPSYILVKKQSCFPPRMESLADAVNGFLCGFQSLLEEIGTFLVQYSSVIADVFFGVGVASLLLRKVNLVPWIGRVFRTII